MCFSATASFSTSGLLTILGTGALIHTPRHMRMLAATPLFFALQQGAEGAIWIMLTRGISGPLLITAISIFLFFAFIFWPTWFPLTLMLLEKNPLRKKLLCATLTLGTCFAFYAGAYMIFYGVSAAIANHHIAYHVNSSTSRYEIMQLFYFAATVVPFFITSFYRMRILGIGISAAYVVSKIWYNDHLTSVWCFFAALLSAAIFKIVIDERKKPTRVS